MATPKERAVHRGMGWLFVLLLAATEVVLAQDGQAARTLSVVEQKLSLAGRMIERLPSPEREQMLEALEALQARATGAGDAKLPEDADALLKDVGNAYRERTRSRGQQQALYRKRYEQRRQDLDMFRESFDAVATERGAVAKGVLDEAVFRQRVAGAEALAAKQEYPEAYAMLDGAYHQLLYALKHLRDRETVEYELEFLTPADEYAYEIRRFESQRMLLKMLITESPPEGQRAEQMQQLLSSADARHQLADAKAAAGDYAEALAAEEAAVADLVKAMRLAGFFF